LVHFSFSQQLSERFTDWAIVLDEFAVITSQAQEPSKLLQVLGSRPFLDCCDLRAVRGHTVNANDVPEVL
jgi:hypothetical protein